jgi:hypothetical protein
MTAASLSLYVGGMRTGKLVVVARIGFGYGFASCDGPCERRRGGAATAAQRGVRGPRIEGRPSKIMQVVGSVKQAVPENGQTFFKWTAGSCLDRGPSNHSDLLRRLLDAPQSL